MRALEQAGGALLMLVVLADVFLTVLYARIGTGLLSRHLAQTTWVVFKSIPVNRGRPLLLSFCGPTILVLLVLSWSILLAVAAGLIIQPELGSGLRASSGQTPRDLFTAVMVGGSSLSIVGSSNFVPQTPSMKMLFLFNSVIGTSVISLTLTYLMQVYSGLRERNAFALKLHALSGETGDAAEWLALLFPNGELSGDTITWLESAESFPPRKKATTSIPFSSISASANRFTPSREQHFSALMLSRSSRVACQMRRRGG